ncbi:hypothetical protein N7448_003348 [Penicillium atrosanguineum]|uniref:Uncharacterized protein n=1 Tax=Penicillium atrosanguineum TaxID=1132637 RepID=A0A9W9PW73_9EURO|nr:uncharacterized protein N7443_002317 [Penicillium atrosanguineum]KAJ5122216.1 hypothetical protein N7526_009153 [Penicillium atrosanguineum]KAJ5139940.1 hypothetical protein N7448_003348 [Penicillium atrosanguineum]KAJ5309856.1 hypothetical protein N7443_002317 [Penicillium atrosanguineum]KAJ5315375.1 hypothetical protein N7476_005682 [Penicillium atrosanguineum]
MPLPFLAKLPPLLSESPEGTEVAEYSNQAKLVKRVNVKLFATALAALGKISYTACVADIEPTTKAAICIHTPTHPVVVQNHNDRPYQAVAFIGTVISAVSGIIRSLVGPDGLGADPRLPPQLIRILQFLLPTVTKYYSRH